ncbi:Ig-like domain-containing protein [Chloroflexota bacterium]
MKRFSIILLTLILVFNGILGSGIVLAGDGGNNPYLVEAAVGPNGKLIDKIIVPGRPPDIKPIEAATVLPEAKIAGVANSLGNVPGFNWSYGCSATSAAMMMGYYDRTGYVNMYAGPENGGYCPMDNSVWGPPTMPGTSGECPLSATNSGIDGRVERGHVDDYWIDYLSGLRDPYITGGWLQHAYGDCTGDYMGTNQSALGNIDGSTTFYYWNNGAPFTFAHAIAYAVPDGGYGMYQFAQSRGYTPTVEYNQYIDTMGLTYGFTFAQYRAEIDAGRPVLIQVEGHTMLGFGYDTATDTVYIHNTWDYSDHQMTWGGSYNGLDHYGVTVLQLEPESDTTPPYTSGHDPVKGASDVPVNTNIVVHILDDGDGVDNTTIAMTVEGVTVSPTISGSAADYTLTYNPPSDFGYLQVVDITVDASDLAGNPMSTDSYSFTTEPESDTTPPYTSGHDPVKGASDVPVNTNIVVHVLDDGDGVDNTTIAMTVEGVTVSPTISGSAADYTLTYNPPSDFGYLQVVDITVDASDLAGNPMSTDSYSFTTEESHLEYFYANQDITVKNSGITGNYLDTYSSDDACEAITERESRGKPSTRYSYLEHKWTIPVTAGLPSYTLYIEAYHTGNAEGDDFIFAYSMNDIDYADLGSVTKTADNNLKQTFTLPGSISGSIYIRVTDKDQTSGNGDLDTINIDHMYIIGSSTPPPNNAPEQPSVPDPADGDEGVNLNPDLSVDVNDPDGDTMDVTFYDAATGGIIETDYGVPSGSRALVEWSDLEANTTYGWYAVADDGINTNTSDTWIFTTGDEPQGGDMYVWDISWASAGKNLKSDVTIRWDSDREGDPELSDELVVGATVTYVLIHQPTGEHIEYIETTDANGQINIQWKKAPAGHYVGEVTSIIYGTYTYNQVLNEDDPGYDF